MKSPRRRLRRPRALALALVVSVTLAGVLGSQLAFAANEPISTVPAPGTTVATQPEVVTVVLNRPIQKPSVIAVTNAEGKTVAQGLSQLVSTNMSLRLPSGLPDGVYEVTFRSEGTSGPEGGSFEFAIGSGTLDYRDVRTWGGYDEVPKSLALPDDAQRQARAERSASPTPSATSSSPTSTTTTGAPDATPSSAPAEDAADSSLLGQWWLWVIIAALVLSLAAGVAWWRAKRA